MTGWTFFFTVLGVAILTAQLFRLIDLIERPAQHTHKAVRQCPSAVTLVSDVL